MQSEEFVAVLEPLFRQIARCLTSSHFQVGHAAALTPANPEAQVSLPRVFVFALKADCAALYWRDERNAG